MYKKYLLSGALLLACPAQATTVSLEYQGFYDRLKQVNKGAYQLVEIAFSVPISDDCRLTGGYISTEKDSYPLTFDKTQRLFVPFDERLKTDRALVNIEVAGNGSQCDLAMQVRARHTRMHYSGALLRQTTDEMDALLGRIQGFPLRYFREPIAGLNFQFAPKEEVVVLIDGVTQTVSGYWQLTRDEISKISSLEFSQAPELTSPWIN
jgi:hypothetical protein